MASLTAMWEKVKRLERAYDNTWEIGDPKKPRTSAKAKAARRRWENAYNQYKAAGGQQRVSLHE